jgi:hypothetical protein
MQSNIYRAPRLGSQHAALAVSICTTHRFLDKAETDSQSKTDASQLLTQQGADLATFYIGQATLYISQTFCC